MNDESESIYLFDNYHFLNADKISGFNFIEVNAAGNTDCIKISYIFPCIIVSVNQLSNLFACYIINNKFDMSGFSNIEPYVGFGIKRIREILIQVKITRNFIAKRNNTKRINS